MKRLPPQGEGFRLFFIPYTLVALNTLAERASTLGQKPLLNTPKSRWAVLSLILPSSVISQPQKSQVKGIFLGVSNWINRQKAMYQPYRG